MRVFRPQAILVFLFWSVIFGVCYTQAPLYYSNQNQYFLHGLAATGRGGLDRDWLATTKDPTPIFSGLVAFTARYLHEGFFYVYYLLILGLYFHSLVGLFTFLAEGSSNTPVGRISNPSLLPGGLKIRPTKVCFITLLVVVHAGVVRWASAQLVGVDYPWFLQAGVAGQYMLGFGLQPSVFGVFLLASVLAFVRRRPWLAVVWACLTAIVHATYLPAAAFLTLAYMVARYRERGLRQAVLLGAFALVLVMPTVIYNLVAFAPSSAANFLEAQHILAHVRIPHHAVIARWLDGIATLQILWIVLALVLARGSLLFLVLLIPFLGSVILTLVQFVTSNDALALLFPWRTSVLLVPLATTIILAKIVVKLGPALERLWLAQRIAFAGTCGLAVGACIAGGLAVPIFELGYRTNRDELPMLEFVSKHHKRGDVYLIPVELPKAGSSARGVFSSNFTPAPRRGKAGGFIAIDLQGFRLTTGTPIYVDFKSIPYKDEEVLEWYRRIEWCTKVYEEGRAPVEESAPRERPLGKLRAELTAKGITHVVAPAASIGRFAALGPPLYQDEAYCVFPVIP